MNGLDQNQKEERKKYEFDTWILSLPPINLYNVELVYLAFGYDQRWDIRKDINENFSDSR